MVSNEDKNLVTIIDHRMPYFVQLGHFQQDLNIRHHNHCIRIEMTVLIGVDYRTDN